MLRTATRTLALIALLGVTLSATSFTSIFKSPDAGTLNFAGKKVAALVITQDNGLRVPAEEALARALTAKGVQGVATYPMVPREELQNPEAAKKWFERAGVAGVVALRPVALESNMVKYPPVVWSAPNYSTLWGYYGYGWSVGWSSGYTARETKIVVEMAVFSMATGQLMWGGVSEVTEFKSLDAYMKTLVNDAVKLMEKEGIVRKK
jgi:hypothetical protein